MSSQEIKQEFDNLEQEAEFLIKEGGSLAELEKIRIEYLGKKGKVSQTLRRIRFLCEEDRIEVGKAGNRVKRKIKEGLELQSRKILEQEGREKKKYFDISLPGRRLKRGYRHPISQMIKRVHRIFQDLGFKIEEGPEVEEERYNFTGLNIDENHPARAEQDSFYLKDGGGNFLLRTHTSPMEIRVMEEEEPPLAMIASGRCFRKDKVDPTHTHTFHQVEGLYVDRGVSFSDLKGVLQEFTEKMFGTGVRMRFRPDFFPFTEPSAEYQIECELCEGGGCEACKGEGWLEVGGCGLTDPKVLEFVGIDFKKYRGYAFGLGIERLAMIHYKVSDIRRFYENHVDFLNQF